MTDTVPDEAVCPECGAQPTDESVLDSHLSSLGYRHEDIDLQCSACENTWTVGVPRGSTDDDTWVCDACGGDFMPHFVYVYTDTEEVRVRPKCRDCYWVPDDPIVLDCSTNDDVARWFVGHHTVTGDRESAEANPL